MAVILPRPRQLVIYCDESADKGRHFSHFYGGVALDETKREQIERALQSVKDEANFQGEAKWTKIGPGHETRCISLVDAFFDVLKAKEAKVRIMFLQNILALFREAVGSAETAGGV